jgi:hypothetical protein
MEIGTLKFKIGTRIILTSRALLLRNAKLPTEVRGITIFLNLYLYWKARAAHAAGPETMKGEERGSARAWFS